MIEEAVLERTLHAALREGGDFAEVFAEDRRVATARASTTARSRSSCRGASAAQASVSCAPTPPGTRTPRT